MPYKKQNTNIMYIYKIHIHRKKMKQRPIIINWQLIKRSSTEEKFIKVKNDYELLVEKFG